MNRQLIRTVAIVLFLFGLLVIGKESLGLRSDTFTQLDLLVDVRHELLDEYVEEVDEKKMMRAAAQAMAESLGDPHTTYLTPEELEPFGDSIRGSFSGIGAVVEIRNNRLHIVSPLDGSPAYRAGVLAGDVVLEIDGKDTEGMAITECVKLLKGEEGTKVTIRVRHESGEETTIAITRARIRIPTVRGLKRGDDNKWQWLLDEQNRVGYIRVSQFSGKTAGDLAVALAKLKAQNARGVILDLRFNPGGLLESANQVASLFLKEDQRIVSVKGRTVREQVFKSSGENVLGDIPMVVLINEGSASASEIVSGALKDNDRALIVGTRSFGKGSVQTLKTLEGNRGAIKVTHAYYYLPSGRNIHRKEDAEVWGVDPADGCYVPMNTQQVRKMLSIRREVDVIRTNGDHEEEGEADEGDDVKSNGKAEKGSDVKSDKPDTADKAAAGSDEEGEEPIKLPDMTAKITPRWLSEDLADPQLGAALEAVLGKLKTGDWPKVGRSGADLLAKQTKRESLLRRRDTLQELIRQVDEELDKLEEKEEAKLPGDKAPKTDAVKAGEPKGDASTKGVTP